MVTITTLEQSGPRSNGKKEYSTIPESAELEPQHQMQFSVNNQKNPWMWGIPLCKGYNQDILKPLQ